MKPVTMEILDGVQCKLCNQKLTLSEDLQWYGENNIAPQYCWIDPEHGSQLHSPAVLTRPGPPQESLNVV